MNIQLSEHFGYRKLLRFTLPSIVMMVFTSIYGVVDGVFVSYDPELLSTTIRAFSNYSVSFLLVGFNIFASSFFTALNDGLTSALISFGRTLVFEVAAVLVLPLFLGIDGVWSAVIAAEGMALVLSLVCLVRNRKKYGYV